MPFGSGGVWMDVAGRQDETLVIRVFDNRGKLVTRRTLTNEDTLQPVFFPAETFPGPGIYFYEVSGKTVSTGKIIYTR